MQNTSFGAERPGTEPLLYSVTSLCLWTSSLGSIPHPLVVNKNLDGNIQIECLKASSEMKLELKD